MVPVRLGHWSLFLLRLCHFLSFSFIVVQPFEFTSAFVYPVLLACCGSRSAGWMCEVVSIGGERDVKVVRLLINVSFFPKVVESVVKTWAMFGGETKSCSNCRSYFCVYANVCIKYTTGGSRI